MFLLLFEVLWGLISLHAWLYFASAVALFYAFNKVNKG
jgi:hypothetical protein